ncbi:3-hydroxyacyl-CoA dehydrogenase family protein [Aromatoleum toluolicum]|nr:3-hydroxyacyl-CoA dehydrogenase family protein [Aromatoleum toluolicum]MCQ6964010.1 3-hydroxyacyl-CoA dehydrogenase family protein [Aromatoleum toluolicum]
MGKTVIRCADRPGFIGNRLGIFWMQLALREAVALGLTVEEADAVMRVCGFPKTGVFGLWDLVGIDLMPSAVESLGALLPPQDDFSAMAEIDATVRGMLDKGYRGRKGGTLQGFYRQFKDASGGVCAKPSICKRWNIGRRARFRWRAPPSSPANSPN